MLPDETALSIYPVNRDQGVIKPVYIFNEDHYTGQNWD